MPDPEIVVKQRQSICIDIVESLLTCLKPENKSKDFNKTFNKEYKFPIFYEIKDLEECKQYKNFLLQYPDITVDIKEKNKNVLTYNIENNEKKINIQL